MSGERVFDGEQPQVTRKVRERFFALRAEGYSYRAIGDLTGYAQETIRNHLTGRVARFREHRPTINALLLGLGPGQSYVSERCYEVSFF